MVNINVPHLLKKFKKVDEPHSLLRETDAKLKMWSKFGLLRYGSRSRISN